MMYGAFTSFIRSSWTFTFWRLPWTSFMMASIRLWAGESGVPLVPLRKNLFMKNHMMRNSTAASRMIISTRSHIGSELERKAFPAAPIRLDVMMDGMTPVATVRMYLGYLSLVPLP